ncbi:MAG: galactokinase [Armatimonadota bacterium]
MSAELERLLERVAREWCGGNAEKERMWRGLAGQATGITGAGGWRALRAPGRVNLIGEHTDYNGLPVMPLALEREIAVLFRPSDTPEVRLSSAGGAYPEIRFQAVDPVPPGTAGDWGNYARAAVQALLARTGQKSLKGFQAVVGGDLPAGGGLSSSSALVVAMALACDDVNALAIPPEEMAELMATGEHYVGTQGGGMDQAICLLGRKGCALKIEFHPLRVEPVPLPAGVTVIVADTLVKAEKSAGARQQFNTRAAECRLAVALVNRAKGTSYRLLADLYRDALDPVEALCSCIRDAPYSLADLATDLGLSENEIQSRYLAQRDGNALPEPPGGFRPLARALHVVEEARRVYLAADAMRAGDSAALGRLMDASHESGRDLYEVTCPELDALADIARKAGAHGARWTGAGFGGCVVALAQEEDIAAILDEMAGRYYRDWLPRRRPDVSMPEELSRALFTTRPAEGAAILRPD